MGHPLILSHYQARPSSADRHRASALAQTLRREQPRLAPRGEFPHLRARRLEDGPVLHLDDLSAITLPEGYGSIDFLEDRARLRACDGDLIVTRIRPAEGYESYCRQRLGLGSVRWIRARPQGPRRHLAASCWVDRMTRAELRRAEFEFIHPHMGSFAVWALADLLARSRHRPLQVIAPPPSLTRAVNDKLWFADVVGRLLGQEMLPRTHRVSNYTTMAYVVRHLSSGSRRVVIKRTDSVGGGGNLVLDARRFRARPLGKIRPQLKSLLTALEWRGATSLLVGSWETDVLAAPSAQLWIPPLEAGEPLVEGLFDQLIGGREGYFEGTRPASLPKAIAGQIAESAWLLGRLFQQLGYVGRCSFDLILVGSDLPSCRIQLVECNGRWGGASLPMTLLNSVLGDWTAHAFACLDCPIRPPAGGSDAEPAVESRRVRFRALLQALEPVLYDTRTGEGELILYNPAATRRGEIAVAGFGQRYQADPRTLTERLDELLSRAGQAA
jgi:hypothetical protein